MLDRVGEDPSNAIAGAEAFLNAMIGNQAARAG
jgi:hypothetical protein